MSTYHRKKKEEMEALQIEIEKSVARHRDKQFKRNRTEHYGMNDSFFDRDRFTDPENLNPNTDMGF